MEVGEEGDYIPIATLSAKCGGRGYGDGGRGKREIIIIPIATLSPPE